MPILNKNIAKKLLQISTSDTSKDDVIESLIPIVQNEIISYCKNDFRDPNAPIYSPSGSLVYPKKSRYNYEALVTPTGYCLSSGISFSGKTIADSNSGFTLAGFTAGMDIAVEGSSFNGKVYEIKNSTTVSAGSLTLNLDDDSQLITEPAGHYVLIAAVIFPKELQLTAIQILRLHLDKNNGTGKSSESIGDYSVSYSSTDYPETIKQQLNRFRNFKS